MPAAAADEPSGAPRASATGDDSHSAAARVKAGHRDIMELGSAAQGAGRCGKAAILRHAQAQPNAEVTPVYTGLVFHRG